LYQDAERVCANTINKLDGGTQWHAFTGEDDGASYGLDSIPDGAQTPWGSKVEREESCSEKTVNFVPNMVKGIVVDGAGGMLLGLGGLFGVSYDSDGWHWRWQTAAASWMGLVDLAAALTPVGMIAPLPTFNAETGQWGSAQGYEVVTGALKGLVAWDEWAKDPGTAAGATLFSVGSFFIGVGEVSAAARGAGAAADALTAGRLGKVAAQVARAGDVLMGEVAARASMVTDLLKGPKVGDLVVNGVKDGKLTIPDVPKPHLEAPNPAPVKGVDATNPGAQAGARVGEPVPARVGGGDTAGAHPSAAQPHTTPQVRRRTRLVFLSRV
jgi:hypothetical protein